MFLSHATFVHFIQKKKKKIVQSAYILSIEYKEIFEFSQKNAPRNLSVRFFLFENEKCDKNTKLPVFNNRFIELYFPICILNILLTVRVKIDQ